MKPLLPPLEHRTTRVRLLASTYEDALTSCAGVAGEHGSRMNLHDSLWTQGSYAELDVALARLNGDARGFRRAYLGVAFNRQPLRALDGLTRLATLLPTNIYVPVLVAENAGYLLQVAGRYEMPEREQRRRFDRRPR